MHHRDEALIALTHVCREWRELFISHSSLWASFDCENAYRTRLCLERSKTSPINLSLYRCCYLPPDDPFFQIIPHAIERLKSLTFTGFPDVLEDTIASLSHPAPLLEEITVAGYPDMYGPEQNPVLTSPLFDGDLPLLRKLHLGSVCTELPWRDMVNLRSFALAHMSVSVGHLLDFFNSAPFLREVELCSTTPTSGVHNRPLVSLRCLEKMVIEGNKPPSLLLDHLLIPPGAGLTTQATFLTCTIEDLLPRSLDNLRNIPDFTTVKLSADKDLRMEFSGPNGQLNMVYLEPQGDLTSLMFEALSRFDTSKTERLKIDCGSSPSSGPPYRVLLPMESLRSLTLSQCKTPRLFIDALRPRKVNETPMVCPILEELSIDGEAFNIQCVIERRQGRREEHNSSLLRSSPSMDLGIRRPMRWNSGNASCTRNSDGANDDGDGRDVGD